MKLRIRKKRLQRERLQQRIMGNDNNILNEGSLVRPEALSRLNKQIFLLLAKIY